MGYQSGMIIALGAGAAALLHVVFFTFESVLWTRPAVRRLFGQTADQAEATRLMALNQGFYNLLLAVGVLVGWGLRASGTHASLGEGMLLVSCAVMVGAGIVLVGSARHLWRGALLQATPPAVALVGLLLERM